MATDRLTATLRRRDAAVRSRLDPAATPVVLRDHALLADGERGIIVGPHGDLLWMCFPRWHDPALFSGLIGGGGSYSVTPSEPHVWGGWYEPGTLIWRSRWVTDTATIECREALALPSTATQAVILRRIIACQGTARVRCTLRTYADFGRAAPRVIRREGDTWVVEHDHLTIRWSGAAKARLVRDHDGMLAFDLVVRSGHHHDLVMSVDSTAPASELPDPAVAWSTTESEWARRVPRLNQSLAPRDAQHACAVLMGLTSASGGMVAAATTSLPERAGEGKSYDYRYAWIRDQCYAGHAAIAAGVAELADSAVSFVSQRVLADGPDLKPAYTVDGARVPEQRHLRLPGYPGGSDIVGNWVNRQFQLDAFGEVLLLLAAAAADGRLDGEGWRALETVVDVVRARWQEPDAGIWELEPHSWTHSRLICVAGLRAAGAVAASWSSHAAGWMALADTILAATGQAFLRPDGAWKRAEDDARPDAALLMATVRGSVAPDDPRSVATLQVIETELVEDGYLYRFQHDSRPLGDEEGAFLLCGFMMALRKHGEGDRVGAMRWFERTRAACGPAGLFCEEYDVRQRQLRGNLPQAFVHALLLECSTVMGQ